MEKEIKSLPPLPGSIVKIQQLCMENEVNVDELTKVIESDPMLSANILKAVNSPLYGMSKEIASIRQAVMLFGVFMIRGFAAANAIKKTIPLELSPYGITVDTLMECSMCQTALVREWIGAVDASLLPLLASGTFLMELGKLVASRKLIASGEWGIFLAELREGKPILEVERCYLGSNSYSVAGMMFEHWNFEPALVEMLGSVGKTSENEYGKILYVVQEAINIKECLSDEGVAKALQALEQFGFDPIAFKRAVTLLKANREASGEKQ
ncbi:MAG: HDOD domain-containing protein [Sulfuricurvum sp.]|uniref:HDOD domain-containing protein n=1 Tax=Sulfuricurvum sp. TaxID=2025608 RepID=UPI0025CC6523|nr:HDOD domain-containing protein [Sulfuricurvum sp.]MCK9372206.1 HDOD domain-containing protein [Sulfuricurvum sp.]